MLQMLSGLPALRLALVTVLAVSTSACAEAVRVNVEAAKVLADEDSTEPEVIAAGVVVGVTALAALTAVAVVVATKGRDSGGPSATAEYETELGYGVVRDDESVRWQRCTSLDICTGEARRESAADVVSIEELGLTEVQLGDVPERSEVSLARIRIRRTIEERAPSSRSRPPI